MKNRKQEVTGILLCVLSLFVFLSFITYNPLETPSGLSPEIARTNIMGIFGIYTSYYLMKFTFGWGTFFLPLLIGVFGYKLFSRNEWKSLRFSSYLVGMGIWVSLFLACIGKSKGGMWEAEYPGIAGFSLWNFLVDIFGIYATIMMLMVTLILLVSGFLNFSIYENLKKFVQIFKEKWIAWQEQRQMDKVIINKADTEYETPQDLPVMNEQTKLEKPEFPNEDDEPNQMEDVNETRPIPDVEEPLVHNEFQIEDETPEAIAIEDEKEIEEGNLDAEKERKAKYRQYKMPTLEYLHDPVEIRNTLTEEELKGKANQLIHALETFGVSGRVVRISPGPVITLFEIEPAEGVRVNKFTNLADDLARVMKAQRVRIIAPIPGSKSVGVELPNENPSTVYLKNIINSEQFIQSKSKLSIGLGKTTTGDAYVFDLAKMPHILVAGATGAGKSVCINTLIVSILYNAKPDEVKFILIDPKKLELATYKLLVGYHLITAPNLDEYVMTTPENAVGILDSAIVEMER